MKTSSTPRAFGVLAMLVIAGCAELEPLTEYRPVVDPERTNMARFERDLEACRAVAVQVEADYRQRQEEQMGANIMAGLLVGAITGMAAGAASTDYTHDLVTFGPRRIVDRCMAERGHAILNDIGRG
jgi:hypothetical protein